MDALLREISAKQKSLSQEDPSVFLKKILTKKEIKHIKLNYFRKGILSFNVDTSVWLFQLNSQKENILKSLKTELPAIKEIRFYLGECK